MKPRFEIIVQAQSAPSVIAHPTDRLLLVVPLLDLLVCASSELQSVAHTLSQDRAAAVLLLGPNRGR